jgi:hypothetical protein
VAAIGAVACALITGCAANGHSGTAATTPAPTTPLPSAKAAAIAASRHPKPGQDTPYIVHLHCPSSTNKAALTSAGEAAVADYQTFNQLQIFPAIVDPTKRAAVIASPTAEAKRAAAMAKIWDPSVLRQQITKLDAALVTFARNPIEPGWASYRLFLDSNFKGTATPQHACVRVELHESFSLNTGSPSWPYRKGGGSYTSARSSLHLAVEMQRTAADQPWRMIAFTESGPADSG